MVTPPAAVLARIMADREAVRAARKIDIPLGDFNVIKTARVFANVTNVFTIDNYEGYDAEVNVEGFVDGGIYGNNSLMPRLRTFNFGLNITF